MAADVQVHAAPERPGPAPVADTEHASLLARALTYFIVMGVFAAAAWAYRAGFYQGLEWPRNTFLLYPGDHFGDIADYYDPLRANDPYAYPLSVYPPFSFVAMEPFSWLRGSLATGLWLVLGAGGLGLFVARQLEFMGRIDRLGAVVVMTVVTYPFLFAFDRGNIEILVTILLAGFVWCLQTDRYAWAAAAIGAAGAMKGYPLLFAMLFVVRGQWRALAIAAATAVVLTFLGSVFYDFDLLHTIELLRERLEFYNDQYVIEDRGLAWGASLFGAVKLLAIDVLGGDEHTIRDLLPVYTVVSALAAAGVFYALWRLPLRFWEQITLLTLVFVALPAVSGDYKLLHLVVPMVVFLREGSQDPWRWWYLLAFGLLMIPKAYVLLREDGTSLGVVVNPLVMLALGIAILVSARSRASLEPHVGRARVAAGAPGSG